MRMTLNAAPPRLSMAMLLAGPLVYGIFLLASWLIQVDEVVLAARPDRPLTTVTPRENVPVKPAIRTQPVLSLAAPPPPLPTTSVKTAGDSPNFSFARPDAVIELGSFMPPAVTVTTLAGRDIQVVRAPAPVIPGAAISRGISGSCDVVFDVDTRGRPFNLTAQCTDNIFRAEAIRAVSKAEFLPKVSRNGVAVEQRGAIYPIAFEVK